MAREDVDLALRSRAVVMECSPVKDELRIAGHSSQASSCRALDGIWCIESLLPKG